MAVKGKKVMHLQEMFQRNVYEPLMTNKKLTLNSNRSNALAIQNRSI